MKKMKTPFIFVIPIVLLSAAMSGLAVDYQKPGCGQAEFKTDEVCIGVGIQSNIYTYKLTNLSTVPIVSLEVKQHAAYNFLVPEGWQKEVSKDTFRAWTDNPQTAIKANQTVEFSMRVSSQGAVLGGRTAKVQFQIGKAVTIPNVWVPVPEPRSYIALVVGIIAVILLLHVAILARREHRKEKDVC